MRTRIKVNYLDIKEMKRVQNSGKWYDPICYQFSFYVLGKETEPWNPVQTVNSFLEDMEQYYQLWMNLQGSIMVRMGTSAGINIRLAKNPDMLREAFRMLITQDRSLHDCEIRPVPGKTNSKFAVPLKTIPQEWLQEVLRYTDMTDVSALALSQKKEWICRMMNCLTDDLKGLYFPQRCFESNEFPLNISFETYDDSQLRMFRLIGQQSDLPFTGTQEAQENVHLHCLHVSLPRCMLRYTGTAFDLQQRWEERLLLLCNTHPSGFGYIKMDRFKSELVPQLLTGNGCFIPALHSAIPEIAWGLCLAPSQAQGLNDFEELCSNSLFDQVIKFPDGHLYLRLTPDVSIVSRDKAKELWRLLLPHLCIAEHSVNSFGTIPVSFRLGINAANLQVNEYGYYWIQSMKRS